MSYRHGAYTSELPTSLLAPVNGTAGLQVVIGTAPVHLLENPEDAVNKPILVYTYKEAAGAVGFDHDFAKYTICEAVSASFQVMNVAPLVLINVLDPKKHKADVKETTVQVNGGVAVLEETGVLLRELVVKAGDTALVQEEDYTASFNSDGAVSLVLIAGGKGEGATDLTVSGKKVDASLITAADIIGGVDTATGEETGMEVIRQIHPRLGLTPGILTAPRWSKHPEVAAALQAKTKAINSAFKAVCIVDVNSGADGARKYADVKEQKEAQALTDANCYPVWLYGKVGETMYSGSALASALTAYYDNDYEFCNVNNNGNTNYNNAEYSYGVAPGFEKTMGQNK